MPDAQIVTGDSRPYTVTLTIDGEPFAITPGVDVVKLAMVTPDRKTILVPAVTLSSTTPGSDWAVSKLVFKLGREVTGAIAYQGLVLLEIQVSFGGTDDWTWFVQTRVVKGTV